MLLHFNTRELFHGSSPSGSLQKYLQKQSIPRKPELPHQEATDKQSLPELLTDRWRRRVVKSIKLYSNSN